MKLPSNLFAKGLKTRVKQIGLWLNLSNNISAEVVAAANFDWLVIDMEHSPNDLSTVLSQLQVFEAYSTTAIVRLDWNDFVQVKRLLDIGAPGLLFPMIQSVKDAERAVAATRYPPKGIRGVAASTRATRYGRVKDYTATVERETLVLLQIETIAALEQAEQIAAVDGVDGILFGPADIAADIGKVGEPMNEAVWKVIMPVARKLIKQGMPVGTLATDADFATILFNEGFSFVACGSDAALLANACDNLIENVKKGLS